MFGPDAPRTRKGMKGAYHYRKINVAVGQGETKFKEEPEKDQYSHPHDALQYIGLEYDNFKAPETTQKINSLLNNLGYGNSGRRF